MYFLERKKRRSKSLLGIGYFAYDCKTTGIQHKESVFQKEKRTVKSLFQECDILIVIVKQQEYIFMTTRQQEHGIKILCPRKKNVQSKVCS